MKIANKKIELEIPEELELEVCSWFAMFLFRQAKLDFVSIDNIKVGKNKKNKNAFYVSDGRNSEILMDFELSFLIREFSISYGKLIISSQDSFAWFEKNGSFILKDDNDNYREINEDEERRMNFFLSHSLLANNYRQFKFKNLQFKTPNSTKYYYEMIWNRNKYNISTKDAFKLLFLTGGIYSC